MPEIQKVLNPNEKVIWEGRPQFLPFLLRSFSGLIGGLLFLGFAFIWFKATSNSDVPYWITAIAFVPGIIGLFIVVGMPLYSALVYKHIWYVITDKRVIFQMGLIGRDFDFVDYDKVESANVTVDLLDKIFGKNSGSIKVYANRLRSVGGHQGTVATVNVPLAMLHITDPYNVFENFKKVSFDIKADIQFPNILRPQENKGYQTEYKDQ